jgi:branched-chain amino acid transport system substrate-binding protein
VANAPGEVILPGEWSKAKELIAAGTDINYEGASGTVEFDDVGDVAGAINYFAVEGGAVVNKGLIE